MRIILSGYNGTMGQVLKNYIQESTDIEIVAGVGQHALEEVFNTWPIVPLYPLNITRIFILLVMN